jgi:hypothetical protein
MHALSSSLQWINVLKRPAPPSSCASRTVAGSNGHHGGGLPARVRGGTLPQRRHLAPFGVTQRKTTTTWKIIRRGGGFQKVSQFAGASMQVLEIEDALRQPAETGGNLFSLTFPRAPQKSGHTHVQIGIVIPAVAASTVEQQDDIGRAPYWLPTAYTEGAVRSS